MGQKQLSVLTRPHRGRFSATQQLPGCSREKVCWELIFAPLTVCFTVWVLAIACILSIREPEKQAKLVAGNLLFPSLRGRWVLLYGLGAGNRLYTVNPRTGEASQVGSGQFAVPLTPGAVGFDFNPTVDRIRFVNEAEIGR